MTGIDFTVYKGYLDLPIGNQVLVKITHSGICSTDEYFKHGNMALGHESVSTVERIGERVKSLQVGDVVGWGYINQTCGSCALCLSDSLLFEIQRYGTSSFDQGSFGTYAIRDASFFRKWELALLYALRLGAAEFYVSDGAAALSVGEPLDHLLVTSSFLPDWSLSGRIHIMIISENDLVIPSMPVVMRGIVIQGAAVASRGGQVKMLDFAALHGVKPIIECFQMSKEGREEAMAKLREGRLRYKAVLVG
ncbi:NADP-dependent alcohol dehydrogenase [Mycena crocata]|nr:NADP-dependent alcohol dehydrogenase [Mycena crocata]